MQEDPYLYFVSLVCYRQADYSIFQDKTREGFFEAFSPDEIFIADGPHSHLSYWQEVFSLMKTTLSAQQNAFFTQNGSIEFALDAPLPAFSLERDLWRKEEVWKRFLLRTLAPIALSLSRKTPLRLAFDQWIDEKLRPQKALCLKELFCIQGLAIGACLSFDPVIPKEKSPVGLFPSPSTKGRILFFKPDLLLDFPHLRSPVLLVGFALSTAVYTHNSHDPACLLLKKYGYHYGDVLRNDTHPLIF